MTTALPKGSKRPTVLDVAKHAGVSKTTVSFVLNKRADERGIPASTIERVMNAARELGYQPDRAARMLRSGRSDLVLFAAPTQNDLGPSALRLMSNLGSGLEEAGLHLVTRKVAAGRPLHELWRDLSPAAVLGMEIQDQDLADLEASDTPTINLDVAGFDQGVAALQAQYLIERGHECLAYAGTSLPRFTTYSRRRLDSVQAVCREAGVPAPVALSLGMNLPSAVAALQELQSHPSVTAICAYDDDHAFALLAGMAELGLAAPRDYALIGADNTPLSAVAVPALTTVDQDVETTAGFLCAILINATRGSSGPDLNDGPKPHIVVRRTA